MDIIPTTNTTILPGQRLITATGYDAADKYPTPRDCVVPIFDSEKDIFYIKTTDTNENKLDNRDQTQVILGNLGRFVAWAGSGSPTTTAGVGA